MCPKIYFVSARLSKALLLSVVILIAIIFFGERILLPNIVRIFPQWIINSNFCLLNSPSPTHVAPSGKYFTIDLFFCPSDLLTKTNFQVHEDIFDSDHFPILLTLAIHPLLQIPRLRFHWKSINFEVNNSEENCTSVTFPVFMRTIRKSMDTHCSCTSFFRPSFPPSWPPRCQNLF